MESRRLKERNVGLLGPLLGKGIELFSWVGVSKFSFWSLEVMGGMLAFVEFFVLLLLDETWF